MGRIPAEVATATGSLAAMLESACYRHPDQATGIVCQRCHRPICPRCMVAGSVGFQCPECVMAGRRQTRQGQLPYGGSRSPRPALTSQVLVGLNAVVWLAVLLTGGQRSPLFRMLAIQTQGFCATEHYILAVDSPAQCATLGASWTEGVATGAWWQVLTNAFTHLDVIHIAFNMAALYVLGPQLESVLGRARFLALYLVSAVTGSAVVMWFSDPYITTMGASGAIFGMMGAVLLIAWKHHGDVRTILVWLGVNVAITFVGSSFISWQGHLGGLLGGMAVTAALIWLPREQRERWQWPLVGLVAVLAVAAIVARAMTITG